MAPIQPTLSPGFPNKGDLGKIEIESLEMQTGVKIDPTPFFEDIVGADLYGSEGASGIITLKGKFIGTLDTLNVPIANLRAIAVAFPTQESIYTSNMFPAGITAVPVTVKAFLTVDVQSILEYELKLLVGTVGNPAEVAP